MMSESLGPLVGVTAWMGSTAQTELPAVERMPVGSALVLSGLFVLSGVLVAALSWKLTDGSVRRNRLMGLRLRSTMRSDAAWEAGQQAFAPYGITAGVGCAVIGATLLFRPTEGLAVVIASAASIWLVVFPAIGAFMGDLAAKDA